MVDGGRCGGDVVHGGEVGIWWMVVGVVGM